MRTKTGSGEALLKVCPRIRRASAVAGIVTTLLLCVAPGTGCGRPVFTDSVRQRYSLTERDLQRIQFFTSDEIVLRREVDDSSAQTAGNEFAIHGAESVEEVVIPARTPCLAIRVVGNYILVSFAPGRLDRALWFGVRHSDGDAPTEGRSFELMPLANLAAETGDFQPKFTKGFLVAYGGKMYRVVDGKMWSVHLLYELKESFDEHKIKEEAPGWRIDDKARPPLQPTTSPPLRPASAPSATGTNP